MDTRTPLFSSDRSSFLPRSSKRGDESVPSSCILRRFEGGPALASSAAMDRVCTGKLDRVCFVFGLGILFPVSVRM